MSGRLPTWSDGGMYIHGVSDLIALVRSLSAMRVLVEDTRVVDGLLEKVEEAFMHHAIEPIDHGDEWYGDQGGSDDGREV